MNSQLGLLVLQLYFMMDDRVREELNERKANDKGELEEKEV